MGVGRGISRGLLRCRLDRPDPRLGAAATVGFIIAGQVVASIILDQFGLLNLPVHSVSLPRLGGAALVVAGAIVVLRT